MDLQIILMLFSAGLVAGCISALAGGSGLITFPVLMTAGLPPVVANATNFMTVLPANVGALPAYRQELSKLRSVAIILCGLSLAGGFIGCILLLNLTNDFFLKLVPWLLLVATFLLAFGKQMNAVVRQFMQSRSGSDASEARIAALFGYLLVFVFSIYGGFFGAGLGVIMLAGLSIAGYADYHEANALKNLTNASIGLLGVIIYALSGLISWPHAFVLMAGSAIGGYFAIRLSRHVPQGLLSRAMIFIGLGLSAYYFWLGQ